MLMETSTVDGPQNIFSPSLSQYVFYYLSRVKETKKSELHTKIHEIFHDFLKNVKFNSLHNVHVLVHVIFLLFTGE